MQGSNKLEKIGSKKRDHHDHESENRGDKKTRKRDRDAIRDSKRVS